MAGSHRSAETVTASAASMKPTNQTLLGAVLGKAERSISVGSRAKGVHGMCRKNGKADQSKERSNDIHDATYFLVGGSVRAGLFQARFVRSGKSFRRKRRIIAGSPVDPAADDFLPAADRGSPGLRWQSSRLRQDTARFICSHEWVQTPSSQPTWL
jgi:hypothetical protein